MENKLSDQYFMSLCLKEAQKAMQNDEVPVGAIVVNDAVMYSSHNEKEVLFRPSAHAEVLAIEAACERLQTWRLINATLYVTVEPCVMCTGIIIQARVKRVVYGCDNPKGGALSFIFQHDKQLGINHTPQITKGIYAKESTKLLSDYFKQKR